MRFSEIDLDELSFHEKRVLRKVLRVHAQQCQVEISSAQADLTVCENLLERLEPVEDK